MAQNGSIWFWRLRRITTTTLAPWIVSYQLPLFGRQSGGQHGLVHRVGAAEGVVEAVHLLEALVALLVDALALRHLVEHGGLRLRVVLHKLHVLEDWGGGQRSVNIYHLFQSTN